MGSMYLGINSNCSINNYAQFVRRYKHNGRNKNLQKGYKFGQNDFINIVEDNFKESKEIIRDFIKNDSVNKTDMIKKIHKIKSKIKLYENDKKDLFEQIKPFLHCKDSKEYISLDNKIQRKIKALEYQKNQLFECQKIHNNLEDKSKYARKHFHEIVFEITSLPKHLLRLKNGQNDKNIQQYGKDLILFFKEQIKENFPNMNITLIALHCDQNGMPHIHLNGFYTHLSMANDLNLKYGKEKQFEQLQQNILHNLKQSPLLHKNGITLEDLKQNEIYLPLLDLKNIDLYAKQKTNKILKNIEDNSPFWGTKDFQIEKLTKIVFEYSKAQIKQQKQLAIAKTKYMGDKNLIKKYELELETTKTSMDKILNPYLNEINLLKNKNNEIISKSNSLVNAYQQMKQKNVVLEEKLKKEELDSLYYKNKYNEIYNQIEDIKIQYGIEDIK